MPRGADGIVLALKEAGVSTIFGIPSIHNIGLYESLRHEPSIRHIGCRHEAGATHMADGYARASGGLGVIVSSTGPGAGFTVSALQEAWGSCSPVLMITTNIDAAKIGQGLGVLHELEEQTSLFRTITKEVIIPRTGDELYAAARRAIALAQAGRPGPVCLEVPTDLMAGDAPAATPTPPDNAPAPPPLPPRLDEAVAILRNAKQPLILAGTDAARASTSGDLAGDIQALAEAYAHPSSPTRRAKAWSRKIMLWRSAMPRANWWSKTSCPAAMRQSWLALGCVKLTPSGAAWHYPNS